MFAHWLGKRWLVSSLIPLLFALLWSMPATGRDAPVTPDMASVREPLAVVGEVRFTATGDTSSLPDGSSAARVTFSRAADGQGRTMYGHRSAFADSSSVVTFSTQRPRTFTPATRSFSALLAVRTSGPVGPLPRFLPVSARLMTSGFGSRMHPILGVQRNHLGVDLAVPSGTPIAATAAGVITYAGWNGGYGLLVSIDHGAGIETRYGHMSRMTVSSGQRVHAGEVLGYVGTTGLTTGPHVHYEVRVNGQAVNPFSH